MPETKNPVIRWVRTEQEAERRQKAAEAAAWKQHIRSTQNPAFAAQVAACAEEERICEGRK